MLWSLAKIITFIVLVAAVAFGANELLAMEGGVQIAFGGIEISLTPLKAVIAVVVLLVSLWVLLKLASLTVAFLRFLSGDETAWSRYRNRNRERRGYQALTEGMMALASGEPGAAMTKAARAERDLQKPELTNLLTAQAAEMAGDTKKAEEVYKRLLKDQNTRFVGIRGIMQQKLVSGDTDTARSLAEKAIALRPKHEGVQDTLLQLQAQAEDWAGARDTLKLKLKHGSLPRDVHKRRDAVLALSEAKAILDEGSDIQSVEAAIEANRLSPDLVPAAALAASSLAATGQNRKAARILKKAWDAQPHPDLAAAFAALVPDEEPVARLKRFRPLLAIRPQHRETRLLDAELNIAAEDFPAARKAMGDLVENAPDARVMTTMAAIARGEGASDGLVKDWLARALDAPRGPQWVCDNCNSIHTDWAPVCGNCQSFDTLSWKEPAEMSNAGAGMLPLLADTPSTELLRDESDPMEQFLDAESDDVQDAEIVPANDPETPKAPNDGASQGAN